ncbi:drug/metabolite transporter (DMT)-like permease [Bacillus oleivorans]|uniref:Drug/metabolite transporter (DMT)-like permease n=1 Tax=Bacillus oleivorans TaxID=1448271 RepID=A0A285CMJ9_9BACI|nr:DMT family transporter [Bacillus oleivorans]SNX68645.1 drug/metabolite transporter (DMT)-like permease [Bacillus oleivorans]
MDIQRRWPGFILVTLGASFWGVGGTVAQRLFHEANISVEWLVSIRLLVAGVLMLLFAFFLQDRKQIFKIWADRKTAFQLVIFGLLGMLAVQYTYMASINLGNAAVATLLQYLAPVFILLYLVLAKVNKLKTRDIIAVILALSGTFLLLTNGSAGTLAVPTSSILWGILSGVALAFYTLYAGRLLQRWGSLNIIGWAMIIGGIGMSIIHPPWQFETSNWTIETYFYLSFVILFGTMLAFWFYLESLKYLKPQETSLLGTLEPLAAIVSSVLWLKISFGMYQLVGTCLILSMILYLSVSKEKKKSISEDRSVLKGIV